MLPSEPEACIAAACALAAFFQRAYAATCAPKSNGLSGTGVASELNSGVCEAFGVDLRDVESQGVEGRFVGSTEAVVAAASSGTDSSAVGSKEKSSHTLSMLSSPLSNELDVERRRWRKNELPRACKARARARSRDERDRRGGLWHC